MATIQASYQHRSDTDAERQVAVINSQELHVTSDRREVWMGSELVNGKGVHVFGIDPEEPEYVNNTLLNWPPRYRNHIARVEPGEEPTGPYTHKVILPSPATAMAPRDGDMGQIFVVLPAVAHAITIEFRAATVGGTLLATLTTNSVASAKWLLSFARFSGGWELIGAAKLEIE